MFSPLRYYYFAWPLTLVIPLKLNVKNFVLQTARVSKTDKGVQQAVSARKFCDSLGQAVLTDLSIKRNVLVFQTSVGKC